MNNNETKQLLNAHPPKPPPTRFNIPAYDRPFRDLKISQNRQVAYLKGTNMKWKLK